MEPEPVKQKVTRLNIGCGNDLKEGFINIDFENADLNIDVRDGLPFETNSIDFIYSGHFIEHLTYDEAHEFLDESFRVLKRGGKIRLSTPDLKLFAKKYIEKDTSFLDGRRWPGPTVADRFNYVARGMGHLYMYDFENIIFLLKSVGFPHIQQVSFDPQLDKRPKVSLFVEAEKFAAQQNPNTPDYTDVMWAGRKFGIVSEQPERIKLYKYVTSLCQQTKILDLGCGDGAFLSYIADDFEKYGIDFSKVAIKKAQERQIGTFEIGDIRKLMYHSNSFDTVVLMEVLEHTDIDDVEKVISEAIRVMKNEASLIVTVPDKEHITDKKWPGGVSMHVSNWSEKKLRDLARKFNLNVAKLDKFGSNLISVLRRQKNAVLEANKRRSDTRFSFVMIVLNGMPFIEYSLKSVYEFAHEIIIVEGAVEKCMFAANPDGSSTDGTLEFIKSFPDTQNKIKVIQGKWLEKCEMQNEALKYVTGDYVWLIDSDEVYKREDLEKLKESLKDNPSVTQVNFIPDNFWKGLGYIFVSPEFFKQWCHYRRLFKYVPGAVFTSHRPPTMVWPGSDKTTEQMRLVDGHKTRKMGIIPYHYSYVLDKQVRQKIELYKRYNWGDKWGIDLLEWYNECFLKWTPANREQTEARYPVWTGDRNSRTQPFTGTHPEVMENFKNKLGQKHRCFEEHALQVIGGTYYQNKVVQAWNLIEVDEPIIKRKNLMAQNIQQNKPFWNIHVALAFLADRLHPENYLEVGTRTGCSLVPVLHNSTIKEAVAVDMWHGSYSGLPNTKEYTVEQINKYRAKTNKQFKIEFVKGDSHKKLKELINSGKKFDLITVDGDHSESGAWEDLQDATKLLADKGAIVFDDIIHPSHSYLRKLVDRFQQEHSEYTVFINSKQDNGCAIFLKNIDPTKLLNEKPSEVPAKVTKGVKVAADYVQTGIKVGAESSFGAKIQDLFSKIRPKKIIETGTYLGTGTTTIITKSLQTLGIDDAMFFTIEVNPQNYARAKKYFETNNIKVNALNGLSVPRAMLPSREEISQKTITDVDYDGIFVDHKEENRVELYYNETNFSNLPDNLLYKCLRLFDFKPDFVLLDSGGHMGNIEFNHLIDNLQGECYIALDDIYHIKHHKSFRQIQSDSRFELVTASKEKFGFCIAKFTPRPTFLKKDVENILWVRTDSIGDGILSSSMLPYVRKRFDGARITVLCQEHVAELYEFCPFIDRIIAVPSEHEWQSQGQYESVIRTIQKTEPGILLNSTYSVHGLSDIKGLEFVPKRLALRHGMGVSYTDIIPTAKKLKPELARHCDFLRGIGVDVCSLEPEMWITISDKQFADEIFKKYSFEPSRTIALFAGARTGHRLYENYGRALCDICRKSGYTVVALGAEDDYEINQRNLEAAGIFGVNLSGQMTLRQTAAILKCCRLAVGAETALAHIACAVKTPNVILLGGGHFGRFMPYSPLTTAVSLPLECYGCDWQCRYDRIYCVWDVAAEVISEAIRQTLSGPSTKPRVFVQGASLWNVVPGGPRPKAPDKLIDMNSVKVICVESNRQKAGRQQLQKV